MPCCEVPSRPAIRATHRTSFRPRGLRNSMVLGMQGFSRRPKTAIVRRWRRGGILMKNVWIAFLLLLGTPAFAQQTAPELQFDSVPDFLKLPAGMNFGEVPGVAVNSRGHIFVFTRSNSANGPAYAPTAAQLLEFGPNGEFVGEVGKGLYAWSFAHSVRIDRDLANRVGARYPAEERRPRREIRRTRQTCSPKPHSSDLQTSGRLQRRSPTKTRIQQKQPQRQTALR